MCVELFPHAVLLVALDDGGVVIFTPLAMGRS
jgi:hypothetical protein